MSVPIDNKNEYFVREFTKRTLETLLAYQGQYDVTMMVNSMVGLLIVPKEGVFNKLHIPDMCVEQSVLHELQQCIKLHTWNGLPCEDNCLHTIIRHLRNSVAHSKMTIKTESPTDGCTNVNITSINFKDSGKKKDVANKADIKVEFEIEVPIELLRRFLIDFAKYISAETGGV